MSIFFPRSKSCQNPFHTSPSLLLSYLLPKIYLRFQKKKKSLMKSDTFDFKSFPSFLLQLYPLPFPHMLLNRKTQKTVSVWRSSWRWNKAWMKSPSDSQKIYLLNIFNIYMYKDDMALNNRQWLICNKTQTNQIIYIYYLYKEDLAWNNLQWLTCHKTQPNQIIYIWYISIKRIWR